MIWLLWLLFSLVVTGTSSNDLQEAFARNGPITYKYRSYSDMVNLLTTLATKFPTLISVQVGQDKYNLGYPKDLQCTVSGKEEPCKQYIVRITNTTTWEGSRPEVFLSGALHGNERIGPNAVMELILLLIDHATREENYDAWIRHLVNTRTIIAMPMTNAWGYDHDERQELTVDTNRDYNYLQGPNCMEAMTSRVVNEVWRDHIFQLSCTFHAGMRAIAYEWGSKNHNPGDVSPDNTAQIQLVNSMKYYGGPFANHAYYPVGTMNGLVYPVNGGFEDWAYAASWENEVTADGKTLPFRPCEPSSYGGYPKEKTMYNNVTNRAFNILIETSNDKHAKANSLGTSESMISSRIQEYIAKNETIGHIPRNMRLALNVVDMVQPYLVWGFDPILSAASKYTVTAQNCEVAVDVVECTNMTCTAPSGGYVRVAWEVLGSFSVDSTHLLLAPLAGSKNTESTRETKVLSGYTRRYYGEKMAENPDSVPKSGGPVFQQCIELPKTTGQYTLTATARVDAIWGKQPHNRKGPNPDIPPQSHVVNARTNPDWHMENAGITVQGQMDWNSKTITVEIVEASTTSPANKATEAPVPTASDTPVPIAIKTITPVTASPSNPSSVPQLPSKAALPNLDPVERPHMASALGYIVIGFGGLCAGSILMFLYLRVFQTTSAYQQQQAAINDALEGSHLLGEEDDDLGVEMTQV